MPDLDDLAPSSQPASSQAQAQAQAGAGAPAHGQGWSGVRAVLRASSRASSMQPASQRQASPESRAAEWRERAAQLGAPHSLWLARTCVLCTGGARTPGALTTPGMPAERTFASQAALNEPHSASMSHVLPAACVWSQLCVPQAWSQCLTEAAPVGLTGCPAGKQVQAGARLDPARQLC